MQVTMNAVTPATVTQLRSVAQPETASVPQDSFVKSSSVGEKIKSTLIIGGVGLVGGALGAYAGLNTGVLAGLAGTVAGASGGALLATKMPSENIKAGALVGAITGAIVGASIAHPAAAVALGVAGATIPVGLLLAVFAGAE